MPRLLVEGSLRTYCDKCGKSWTLTVDEDSSPGNVIVSLAQAFQDLGNQHVCKPPHHLQIVD